MFGERFVQTMAVAARDVRVRLDMPPRLLDRQVQRRGVLRRPGRDRAATPGAQRRDGVPPDHRDLRARAEFDQAAEFTRSPCAGRTRSRSSTARPRCSQKIGRGRWPPSRRMLKKGAAVFAYAEAPQGLRARLPEAASLDPALAALARRRGGPARRPRPGGDPHGSRGAGRGEEGMSEGYRRGGSSRSAHPVHEGSPRGHAHRHGHELLEACPARQADQADQHQQGREAVHRQPGAEARGRYSSSTARRPGPTSRPRNR